MGCLVEFKSLYTILYENFPTDHHDTAKNHSFMGAMMSTRQKFITNFSKISKNQKKFKKFQKIQKISKNFQKFPIFPKTLARNFPDASVFFPSILL
jgi:hypothetical protein